MKTSIVLLTLIVLNTSALLSETLATWVKDINPWVFIAFEIVLLVSLYLNYLLKGLQDIAKVDFNGIDLFVVTSKDKTQGKP